MATVKINNQFHYISVKVTFTKGQWVTMTWSHGGMKLSGKGCEWIPLGKLIMRSMEQPKGVACGEWTRRVGVAAAKAASVAELADCLKTA